MAAAVHKGPISVSLLHIPIALYTATQDVDIHFNQLCPDGSKIKYNKICASCGEEIPNNMIQRGFEVSPGNYIVITDDDLEAIKTPRDRTIQILHTCDRTSIPMIYYEKTYHTLPEAGGDHAYELFRVTLLQTGKVAIAKTVMGNSEVLMALVPTEEELMVQTLYFEDEIRAMPREARHPELSNEEKRLAVQIVSNLDRPFDPAEHRNEFQGKLRDLVERKVAGQEIVAAPADQPNNIVSLMDALTAAVEETGETKAKKKAPPRRRAGQNQTKAV